MSTKTIRILLSLFAALCLFVLVSLISGCEVQKQEPKCNPNGSVVQLYHAKCYMGGHIVYDDNVVCPLIWISGSVWRFYDEKSRSVIKPENEVQCFVLKVRE